MTSRPTQFTCIGHYDSLDYRRNQMLCQITRMRRVAVVLITTLLLTHSALNTGLAHESREGGPYALVVGWAVEPALVEQPNSLSLRVTNLETDEPVEGLAETLEAEVLFGDQQRPLELRAQFGEPGAYSANVIPTRPGSYLFR